MAMQSLISGGKQAPIDFCGVDAPAMPPNPLSHIGIFKASDFLAAVIDHIPPKGLKPSATMASILIKAAA